MGNVVSVTHKGREVKKAEAKAAREAAPHDQTKHTRCACGRCKSIWVDSQRYPPAIVDNPRYEEDVRLDRDDMIFKRYAECPICKRKTFINYYPNNFVGRIQARDHANNPGDFAIALIGITILTFAIVGGIVWFLAWLF